MPTRNFFFIKELSSRPAWLLLRYADSTYTLALSQTELGVLFRHSLWNIDESCPIPIVEVGEVVRSRFLTEDKAVSTFKSAANAVRPHHLLLNKSDGNFSSGFQILQ